jgi:hypothetical protein
VEILCKLRITTPGDRLMPRWPERTIEKRFSDFVDDSAGPDECWPWTGAFNRPGSDLWGKKQRPLFRASTKSTARRGLVYAHRFALFLTDGVPLEQRTKAGLEACHRCNNTKCVNPRHLYWGTSDDNVTDRYPHRRAAQAEQEA